MTCRFNSCPLRKIIEIGADNKHLIRIQFHAYFLHICLESIIDQKFNKLNVSTYILG